MKKKKSAFKPMKPQKKYLSLIPVPVAVLLGSVGTAGCAKSSAEALSQSDRSSGKGFR